MDSTANVSAESPPSAPDLQMSPAMAAIFQRIQREDGHLPNVMHVPWEEAQANFHHTQTRWNRIDDLPVRADYFDIPGPRGPMAAVRLTPLASARPGTVLFLHGGGWVFGSIQTHRGAMARLAELTGLTVVGIDYGLAPQAPFPQGLDDAAAAWHWLQAGGPAPDGLAPLTGPWLVSGDSAGANVALAMLLDLRDAGAPLPDAALLLYGVYSANHETPSHQQCGGGQFGLSTERMAWFRKLYLGGGQHDPDDPRVSPLLADLSGLPPIYLNAAGLDCLRDDSVMLAQGLAAAGVPHQFRTVEGVTHGFMHMSRELPEAMDAFRDAAAFVETFLPG